MVEQGMNFSHLNTTHLLNTHTQRVSNQRKKKRKRKQASNERLLNSIPYSEQSTNQLKQKKKTVTESSTHFMNQEHQNDDMSFLKDVQQSKQLINKGRQTLSTGVMLVIFSSTVNPPFRSSFGSPLIRVSCFWSSNIYSAWNASFSKRINKPNDIRFRDVVLTSNSTH